MCEALRPNAAHCFLYDCRSWMSRVLGCWRAVILYIHMYVDFTFALELWCGLMRLFQVENYASAQESLTALKQIHALDGQACHIELQQNYKCWRRSRNYKKKYSYWMCSQRFCISRFLTRFKPNVLSNTACNNYKSTRFEHQATLLLCMYEYRAQKWKFSMKIYS